MWEKSKKFFPSETTRRKVRRINDDKQIEPSTNKYSYFKLNEWLITEANIELATQCGSFSIFQENTKPLMFKRFLCEQSQKILPSSKRFDINLCQRYIGWKEILTGFRQGKLDWGGTHL